MFEKAMGKIKFPTALIFAAVQKLLAILLQARTTNFG